MCFEKSESEESKKRYDVPPPPVIDDPRIEGKDDLAKSLQQYHHRDEILTNMLEDYRYRRYDRETDNKKMKNFLFRSLIGIVIVFTGLLVTILCKAIFAKDFFPPNLFGAAYIFSLSVTYLVSLLAILKTISKYLFPEDEDKGAIELIKIAVANDHKYVTRITNEEEKNQKKEGKTEDKSEEKT